MTTTGPAATRFVGHSVTRREDPRLLAGRGRYVDDVALPGMLHIAFVRSDTARGRIVRLDVGAARALEGVHAVLTAADLNPIAGPMWSSFIGPPTVSPHPPLRPLADGDVRFVGDPIAVVVADSRYLAEDAVDLVDLEIEPLQPVVGAEAALDPGAPVVHPELGTNVASSMPAVTNPALDDAFASARHVVTRRFTQARATNMPLEPRGLVAEWDDRAGDLRIWSSTQSSHEFRAFACRLLGLSEHRVRVLAGDVGGGFGQKIMVTRDEAIVLLAARRLPGRPLKWTEDRRENLHTANQAHAEHADVSLALDDEGLMLAMRCHYVEDVGAYPVGGTASTAAMVGMMLPGPYRIPVVGFSSDAVYTNTCGRAAYRGPWMMETVCREQLVDHAARAIGLDPVELRRRNLVRPEDLPFQTATGMVYDVVTPTETLDQALDILGYDAFRRDQDRARREGRHLGVGVSVYIEPSALSFGIQATEPATLRMEPNGSVTVLMGTGSHGQSLETTIAQVVAEHLGCDLDDVTFVQGDTTATPYGAGTGGSRSAVFGGGAAQQAAEILRGKVLEIAGHLLEAAVADLEVSGGVVTVRGAPARPVSFAQVAATAYTTPDLLPPGTSPELEVSVRFRPPSPITWSNACHVCTCEVDVETGIVRLLRYVVSEDCGRMINPMVVEGQVAGGVAQGIGGALYEHMVYGDDGTPLTTTLLDYLVPLASDVPPIEIGHVETPSAAPGGYKGMGEGGAIGSPAAVANAVADALAHLGIEPTRFPLGPSELRALLRSR